ncbi:MAG TPA: hypothetical protein VLM05_18345, partial [Mycobacteriales bacterium]|nr:hypothetical protein [Mycobacteriales bacterium]
APPGGDEGPDPFAVDEVPPLATPAAPVYDSTELLEPTPAYDSLAQETDFAPAPALTPETDYALAPNPGEAGPLAQVKAFAADKPAVFLGLALAAGWLVGKIFSSSDDDD